MITHGSNPSGCGLSASRGHLCQASKATQMSLTANSFISSLNLLQKKCKIRDVPASLGHQTGNIPFILGPVWARQRPQDQARSPQGAGALPEHGRSEVKAGKKSHLSVNIPNSCCSHFLKTELLFAGASLSLSRGYFVLDFQAKLWE